jgi:exopolysaccharide production protein ExoQ
VPIAWGHVLAIEQARVSEPAPETVPEDAASNSVWQLALSWILLIPLLFISSNASLFFLPRTGDEIAYEATGSGGDSSVLHKIILAVICVIWTSCIAFRLPEVASASRRMKAIIAFPLLAILSCAWSDSPIQSIESGFVLLIFTFFAIYLATRFTFQKQLELIIMVGAVALPLSIAAALFAPSIGIGDQVGWRGIFGHKQTCAGVCTLWLIAALAWRCSAFHHKVLRTTYILMCVALIIMSQSRTGWALALVALLLWFAIWILQKMPGIQVFAILFAGIPAIAAAVYGIRANSADVLASVGKDATLSERTIIWAAAWDSIMQHPILGYGFAAFWKGLYGPSQSIVLIAGWALAQAQDGFLDVWLQVGVLGVALIAIMTVGAIQSAFRCFNSKEHEAYVRWCLVMVACALIFNIGETSIGLMSMTWFLFLMGCIGLKQVVWEVEGEPDKLALVSRKS